LAALARKVQPHFGRRNALGGPPGNLGRFFPRLTLNGSRLSAGVAGVMTRHCFL